MGSDMDVDAPAPATSGTYPESESNSSQARLLMMEKMLSSNTTERSESSREATNKPVDEINQQVSVPSEIDVDAPATLETGPESEPKPELDSSRARNRRVTMTSEPDVDAPGPATHETKPEPEPSSSQALPLIMETISERNTTEFSEASREAIDKYLHFLHKYKPDPAVAESPAEQVKLCLEDIILRKARGSNSADNASKIDMATATAEEKAAERQRILDAPTTKHRFTFQEWPRDPKGEWIKQDGPERKGKQTSNGLDIWGATLYDFYSVHRFPEEKGLLTLSSGSRIAAWMKMHGETYAVGALQAASEEAEPHIIKPLDIGEVIQDHEDKPWHKRSWAVWHKKGKKGKGRAREDWELPDNWPPKSPFDPRAYPAPWPHPPFNRSGLYINPPNLQAYIPPSRLPAKLVVHDPARLLKAVGHRERNNDDPPPTTEDITHVYRLSKSTTHTARTDSDEAELASQEAERVRVRAEFLKSPSSNKALPSGMVIDGSSKDGTIALGPCKPPIFIVFPHLPERAQPPEAHLYLSPEETLGTGGHSYVYRAELEVPRSYLVDEVMCPDCVIDDLRKILEEQDGVRGEKRDKRWDFKSGRQEFKVKTRTTGATVILKDENGVEKERLARAPNDVPEVVYEGPYRAIETRVKYQDLALAPYCEHLRKKKIHPLTSKVCVAAKLSIAGDAHLARESENYQAFPRHFFEHWNGYNIVYPLHDPVPVTPVVPQYYGYYVIDRSSSTPSVPGDKGKQKESDESTSNDAEKEEEYLSPILLLEDCGKMINPDELSIDDKQECAGLLYRFHEGDWLHNSVARRNIVRQPGPLTAWPIEKWGNMAKRDGCGIGWSYRLIDFGRSVKVAEEDPSIKIIIERSIMQNWTMGMAELL